MRLSELTAYEVSSYLMLDEDEDTGLLPHLLAAAKSYIAGYTGLDETELDAHEDITVAALILCADLYDNRLMVVDNSNANITVQTILNLHRNNLI